jgi:MFS family permease
MIRELDGSLRGIFLMNIGFAICYYLVTPLFPLFLDTLKVSESQIGLILGIGSFSATFSTLISGYLTDRLGTNKIFYSSLLLRSVSTLAIIYAEKWVWMIPIWVVFNLSQSLFEPARLSYVGEKATKENIGKLYGVMNLAWPIAGILGPFLSGNLAESRGWNQVFLLAVVINCVGLVPLLFVKEISIKKTLERSTKFDVKYLPQIMLHFCFHVFIITAIGLINMTMPLYLANNFNLQYSTIGLFFTLSNVLSMITQIPSGVLADKYGMKKITLICISLIPFTYLAWLYLNNWILLLVSYTLSMGLWSMTWGATTVLVSEAVPKSMTGTAISIRMTAYKVGYTLGPILAGYLLSNYGNMLPFFAAIISMSLAIPICLNINK